jgi:hypothetical protein
MVSVEIRRCQDCKFCGRKSSGDRYCIHPFMKRKNNRSEIFILPEKDVNIETRCTMLERRK